MGRIDPFFASLCKDASTIPRCDFADKDRLRNQYSAYNLMRLSRMIVHDGLPDTIPQRALTLILQTHGYVIFPDPKFTGGKLCATWGALSDILDAYYMPTRAIISNPYLHITKRDLKIGEECVVIPHDSLYLGLLPLISRYSELMTENDVTLRRALINTRAAFVLSASDDPTKKRCEEFLEAIEAGDNAAILESAFFDGIRVQPGASVQSGAITQLIESKQYLRGAFFNEIGLNANYNMKREAINSAETKMDTDALLPLVDDIFETQKRAFEELNAKGWADPITPRKGSAWADVQAITDAEVETAENENEGGEGNDVQEEENPNP